MVQADQGSGRPFTRTRWWWIRHAPVRAHGGRIYGQADLACDCSDEALLQSVARVLRWAVAKALPPLFQGSAKFCMASNGFMLDHPLGDRREGRGPCSGRLPFLAVKRFAVDCVGVSIGDLARVVHQ